MLENKLKEIRMWVAIGILSFSFYNCSGFACRSPMVREFRSETYNNANYCRKQIKEHGYCKKPQEYSIMEMEIE